MKIKHDKLTAIDSLNEICYFLKKTTDFPSRAYFRVRKEDKTYDYYSLEDKVSYLFHSSEDLIYSIENGDKILFAGKKNIFTFKDSLIKILDNSIDIDYSTKWAKMSSYEFLFTSNKTLTYYNSNTNEIKKLSANFDGKEVFVNHFDYVQEDKVGFLISDDFLFLFSLENERLILKKLDHKFEYANKNIKDFHVDRLGAKYRIHFDGDLFVYDSSFTPPFTSLKSKFRSIKIFDNEKEFLFADSTLEGNLSLDYNQNNLTIRMETITNFEPETVYYLYQLEGPSGSEKWIRSDIDSVQLSNLAPGKYTYRFKSVNGYGIESEIHEYSFTIYPPWYATWWFRGSAGAGLLLIFFVFYKARTAQMRKRQKVLENTVKERTKEVVEQKAEAEKQRDIAHEQKQVAEEQKEIAETQKHIVEEKNQEILDSISYAKRLQNAILPPPRLVKEWLNDSFIFYKPKDIVAGDFYWMETTKREGRTIILFAAADCTGHGVPGAMVSVVCSNAMNRATKEFGIHDPGLLLDKVVELVKSTFEQSEDTVKDGMDIALCALDLLDRKVWFAGAHNPLYRITDIDTPVSEELRTLDMGERKLIEYKASKQPVGAFDHMEPFQTTEIQLEPGDCIYLFSDGYADQFGGEKGKKYKYADFKKLLMEIESKEMDTQKEMLDVEFNRWKGELEQIDDICIIGLRVNGHMRKIFSNRELEIIQKIKEGLSSKMIADDLNIAKTTVDTHRKRILAKVNLHSAPELIKFCEEHEIL
ncbi:MAG: SpoIIE family protein phosphatase [Crocinitomicaceae bacterium]